MYARAAVLPLFLFLIDSPLNAQVMRGRVTDYATGELLHGAAVLLLDENGRGIAQTTTDTTGLFELRAARAGAFQLNVSLIGYLPFTSVTLSLSLRETMQVRIQIATQPIPVAPLVVTARSLGVVGWMNSRGGGPGRALAISSRERISKSDRWQRPLHCCSACRV
ncbi:MAG: carboxypeptidase-like regulatory domain-containing protein [Gemmatimonadota bacterium]